MTDEKPATEWQRPPSDTTPWQPNRYEVTVWHDHGKERFVVVSRLSEHKAVALAALHFKNLWPDRVLYEIKLIPAGIAEFGTDESGAKAYPPPGDPSGAVYDAWEWM